MSEQTDRHILYSADLGGALGKMTGFAGTKKTGEARSMVDIFFDQTPIAAEHLEPLDQAGIVSVQAFARDSFQRAVQDGLNIFCELAKSEPKPEVSSISLEPPEQSTSKFPVNYGPDKPSDQATKLVLKVELSDRLQLGPGISLSTPIGTKAQAVQRVFGDLQSGVTTHFSTLNTPGRNPATHTPAHRWR